MILIDLPERIQKKIEPEPTSGCWLWVGATSSHGYGGVSYGGRSMPAHRAVYLMTGGQIPDGLDLDHLCRVRSCVNPRHLEPVTRKENLHRGPSTLSAIHTAKTHCPAGHPFSAANTYYRKQGYRRCRACVLQQSAAQYRRRLGPAFGAELDEPAAHD